MISDRLKAVLLRTLKLEDFQFTQATTAPEVPGWDSLSHISVLAAVEEEYRIRLKGLEVMRLRTVGDLQVLVDRKTQVR